ncbi:MAG: hypothetical protein F4117_15695 [Acidimicrobiales bacterium]|nr:hypothetical protein [Acidimicrobiales bacterium]MYA26167.1 hypothetical protein [Acidimicrobiales bacterium]MYB81154.1 hypothetical protein [Acidimicrobiales bacterium]MYD84700.1 hypothetical protein [Acidimicrobiales bacterium]MYH75536.1 hypothetical protein [Acidimicrobiales bacterium]
MDTLTAPATIGGRELPRELLESGGLPDDLTGASLTVQFEPGIVYTISFVDELVLEALVRRHCDRLVLQGLSPSLQRVAREAAEDHELSDRLVLQG